ncbi:MAG: NrfD/PsrC family molybdoenzyme membrane anchor subunit [Thermodesulfobacteriota bacterium]|nr:NrfD/PsrC family molybdoenzyme membrane anchor subunit [Thermodesulfobacteriota bacterium]
MKTGFSGFVGHAVKSVLTGNRTYTLWMFGLIVISLFGLNAFSRQIAYGLYTTGMGDEVSWGLYISNFAFLVGMAAAAVMMVIPAYIFKDEEIHKVVIFTELWAIAALIMCLLFITADIGRPDRLWHMIPVIGVFNWPMSLLTWDVLVLNGYLLLNLYVCGYVLYRQYNGQKLVARHYIPFVFLAIAWAPLIHTITAFLFQGLAARPFWHSGLIAPRFLASAFAAGPAFIILVFKLMEYFKCCKIHEGVIAKIRIIVTVSLLCNLLLVGSELFTELYSGSEHSIHLSFLLGFHGKSVLAPWMWSAIGLNIIAAIILLLPVRNNPIFLNVACLMILVGIWVEKGLGFVISGFIPTPLGDFVQYQPSFNELVVCFGILAFGLLVYTALLKVAVPIINRATLPQKE